MIEHKVDQTAIITAVEKIEQIHSKWLEEVKKKPLLDEPSDVLLYLQVTLKKIPPNTKLETIKISLPHFFITDATDICLITGDLDKRNKKAEVEPTIEHYKNLLRKRHVQYISEVIPLRQLRTDYKPFEARRQLVGAYDIFLADRKIYQCLGRALGSHFIKNRKFPQAIDINTKDLNHHIEKALHNTFIYISGHGNTCSVKVSRLGLPIDKTVENINALIKGLEEKLPGSWANVNGLYLKSAKSKALPIYVSFESGNDVVFKRKHIKEKVIPEEVTTLKKTKVQVFSDGGIQLVSSKDEEISDTDDDFEDKLLTESKHKKMRFNSIRRKKTKTKSQKKAASAEKTKNEKRNSSSEGLEDKRNKNDLADKNSSQKILKKKRNKNDLTDKRISIAKENQED